MTEEEIKQIVRDEIEKSRPLQHHKGIPLPPNDPVAWPVREIGSGEYRYRDAIGGWTVR